MALTPLLTQSLTHTPPAPGSASASPLQPGMRLEDLVRTAAPYCLKSEWHPDVDREMVLLQAEVHYIEAEATVAALRKRGADVVPPAREVRYSRGSVRRFGSCRGGPAAACA